MGNYFLKFFRTHALTESELQTQLPSSESELCRRKFRVPLALPPAIKKSCSYKYSGRKDLVPSTLSSPWVTPASSFFSTIRKIRRNKYESTHQGFPLRHECFTFVRREAHGTERPSTNSSRDTRPRVNDDYTHATGIATILTAIKPPLTEKPLGLCPVHAYLLRMTPYTNNQEIVATSTSITTKQFFCKRSELWMSHPREKSLPFSSTLTMYSGSSDEPPPPTFDLTPPKFLNQQHLISEPPHQINK